MTEASFFRTDEVGMVVCELCPHHCRIKPEGVGICGVRQNLNNRLYSLNYGVISSASLDPIEKKPLYNYYPGSKIFSIGSIGCNLQCVFCQNWQIARATPERLIAAEKSVAPKLIVEAALNTVDLGNIGIAYTYNEPTVWFEYMRDIASLTKETQLKYVMVTYG